jgi:hypothetical protein
MDEEGISIEEFKEAFEKGNMFASSVGKFSAECHHGLVVLNCSCSY